MKRILITGKDSYIGTSFEKWVSQWPEKYEVTTIDTISKKWKRMSFDSFDVILHVAAIVHKKNISRSEYMDVNCKLPFNIAQKAKGSGVKQFVFISSMSIYGKIEGIITNKEQPRPTTLYAKSKYEAEKQLQYLEDKKFKVAIIRPPMVYGKGCKGNYDTLSRFAKKVHCFPDYYNKRSMIYIDNLINFLCFIIRTEETGIYCPQNEQYVCTKELVNAISIINNNQIHYFKELNWVIKLLVKKVSLFKKVFGDLCYCKELSNFDKWNYNILSFEESIIETEYKEDNSLYE